MNITSQLVVELVARALLVSSALCGADPIERTVLGQHVRTADHHVAAVVAEAARRSTTVRHLLRRLAASDVLIFVERAATLDAALDGQLTFMTSAGGFRYVRVQLRGSLTPLQQMAALGHELSHAVEIAEAPQVVDAASMAKLYQRIGFQVARGPRAFESRAALDTERQVRSDLLRASPRLHADLASPTRSRQSRVTAAAYTSAMVRAEEPAGCPAAQREATNNAATLGIAAESRAGRARWRKSGGKR